MSASHGNFKAAASSESRNEVYEICVAGKAAVITIGGLVVGAVIGSAAEQWLQVDIVPFYGIHSPAVIVTEFILFSQLLVSLYLR